VINGLTAATSTTDPTSTDVERREVKAMMGTTGQKRPRLRYRICVTAALAATFVLLAASSAWAATGGYGPGGPGNAPPPGGFGAVITARTVGKKGAHLVVAVPGGVAIISVAPKTFPNSVILKITGPDLGQITSGAAALGFPGSKAVEGIGVDVLLSNGKPAPSPFAAPIVVTLYGPSLGATGERVLSLTGPTTTAPIGATIGLFYVGFSVTGNVNVAVLNPPKKPRSRLWSNGWLQGGYSGPTQGFGVLAQPAGSPSNSGAASDGAHATAGPAADAGSPPSADSWMTATPVTGRGPGAAIDSAATPSTAVADGAPADNTPSARNAGFRLALGALAIVIGFAIVALYAAKRGPRKAAL
jgi:hypothetical protein